MKKTTSEEPERSGSERLLLAIFGGRTRKEALEAIGADPSSATEFEKLKSNLGKVLQTLTEREEKVLEMRFGLKNGHPQNLEEVGKKLKLTRERIRQIEARALRRMRHPERIASLKGTE